MNSKQCIASIAVGAALSAALFAQDGGRRAAPASPAASAGPATVAIVGARIVPVSGPVIPVGTVVLEHGKIAAVGADIKPPAGARIIMGKGKSVYPGMFDADTTVGIEEISGGAIGTVDTTEIGAFNPQLLAGIGVNPGSDVIGAVRANGVTTVLVSMRGGTIPAQSSIVDLGVYTNDQMNVRRSAALWINLPGGGGGRGGGGRGGFPPAAPAAGPSPIDQLKDYMDAARRYAAMGSQPGYSDLAMAAMVPYVTGKLPVIIAATTALNIRDAIAFGKEQKLNYILGGARDAWEVTDEIKSAGCAVLYGPVIGMPGSANDPYDAVYSAPAALAKAGIPFAIVTAEGPDSRNLAYTAAFAEAYGLAPDDALKAVTLWPAKIFGVDGELGSIAVGKRANVILTTGDPMDPRTQIEQVYIDGNLMPDSKQKRLYDYWMARPDGGGR